MKTLGDLVQYVMLNRRGKAFTGWTEEQVAWELKTAAEEATMQYAMNQKDEIVGIVLAMKSDSEAILYVKAVLTTEKWAMKQFVETFKQRFPNFQLRACRWKGSGKTERNFVKYNTERLVHLFLKKGEVA